ncbi:Fe-S cluster assembly protein [Candidatus Termititenax dinenymphae]|uniref:Nitrogen fixation protein NifU n=2 Tax=Candidatus Termititenax dinenymphae TaxID=2218523 RepID=A0A388TKR9_9BACT|nr:Fe-S cluster assembly protein [Candidatus Termititenax dinenymphae]
MSKDDLIGLSLWEAYSQKVHDRMNNPRHGGSFTDKDAQAQNSKLVVADFGDASCGDSIQLFWLVDTKTDVIKDARFLSFGCGTAIASADVMAELTIGKTVDEASKITNLDVEKELRDDPDTPAFPGQKMHCSVMAYDVIKRAVAKHKNIDISTLEDQEIVCDCARVTLGMVVDVIRKNDLKTVEDITRYTKAGGYCKSCIREGGHEKKKYYLEDILRDTRKKMADASTPRSDRPVAFLDLPKAKQFKLVEDIFNLYLAPVLAKDKGGLELADINGKDVQIVYQGACHGCASAETGTLKLIESTLREKLDPEIGVSIYRK